MVTRQEGKKTTYEVFDTKSEADQARKVYEKEQASQKSNLIKPKADESSLEVAARAAKQALLLKMAKEAAAKEAKRTKMQQLEEQKRAKQK